MEQYGYEMCRLCGEMAKSQDLRTTLDILARNITLTLNAKGCTIRILDQKNRTLEIIAAYGLSKAYLEKGPVILNKHPVDRDVLQGKVIKTKDILAEPHLLYVEEARQEGIKSVLSLPLVAEEKPIGVVRVYTSVPHDFTDKEIETIRTFVMLGGILADRVKIWEEMRALINISQSISSTLSLGEVLQMIVENAAKALGMKAASIRLLSEDRRTLEVKAAYGLSRAYLEKGAVEVEKSPLDRECLQCKTVSVPDIEKDERLQYPEEIMKEGIKALLSLPLIVRGTAIGVLRVYTSQTYTFTESDINFLTALACQGAIAIENARLFEHIKNEYEDLAKDVWKWYDWGERFPKV